MWAKALGIVFLLGVVVLSAVFAGAQMVLFSRRQNYYTAWQTAQASLKQTEAQLNKKIQSVEEDLGVAREKAENITTERNRLEQTRDELMRDVQNAKKEIAQLQATNEKLLDTEDKLAKALGASQTEVKQLTEYRRTLEDTTRKQGEEISNLKLTLQERENKVTSLEQALAQLEKTTQSLRNELSDAKSKIQQAIAAGFAFTPVNVPPIDARVLKVDPELGAIVLSVGEEQGVKQNYPFVVYRDGKFVAKVSVSVVGERTSVARPVLKSEGSQIQVGDAATTRLY